MFLMLFRRKGLIFIIITIFDNLVCYTCINVQFNKQTPKIVCTRNISKINNVQTLFKHPNFVHLCHELELENNAHSCFIC